MKEKKRNKKENKGGKTQKKKQTRKNSMSWQRRSIYLAQNMVAVVKKWGEIEKRKNDIKY